MYKSHNIMSILRDMKLMPRDKSVDLTGVLSCRATLLECLRRNHLSLQQVSSMWRHKPHLLLFRSIAGTGDLLSNHAPGILFCFVFPFCKTRVIYDQLFKNTLGTAYIFVPFTALYINFRTDTYKLYPQ